MVFEIWSNYETNPKSSIQEILSNSIPTSISSLLDIINFYTRDIPPPIYRSFCSTFSNCKDLVTNDIITIDKLNMAFKMINKSEPGLDRLLMPTGQL